MTMNNVAELQSQLANKIKEMDAATEAGNLVEAEARTVEAETIKTQIALGERRKKLQIDAANLDDSANDVANSIEARTGTRPKTYSVRNLVLSEGAPGNTALREAAEFEHTVSKEAGLVSRDGGSPIPMKYLVSGSFGRRRFDPEKRVITSASTNAVATEISIDNYAKWLGDSAPVMEYVTLVPGLTGNFDIPIISTKTPNVSSAAEGEAPTVGDPTFGKLSLTPHQIQGMVEFSNQSLIQTEGFVETALRENLADSVANDLASNVLVGGATDEPDGAREIAGTNTQTYTAADRGKWAALSAARWAVDGNNIPRIRRAYFLNTSVLQSAENIDRSVGSGRFVYDNGMIGIDPAFPTGLVPSNDGVYGEWSECYVGLWDGSAAGSEIIVDKITKKGRTLIALILFHDVGFRRPKAFTKLDQS